MTENLIIFFRTNWRTNLMTPILYTELEMDFSSGCYIKPSLDIMQNDFNNAVLCCTEINLFVSTWGKQAKTQERNDRRVTAGESIPTRLTLNIKFCCHL